MNKEQLHRYISESTGNESNICQIYAIKDNEVALDDCWHGFKTLDAMNVNSVTKGIVALLAGVALDNFETFSFISLVLSLFCTQVLLVIFQIFMFSIIIQAKDSCPQESHADSQPQSCIDMPNEMPNRRLIERGYILLFIFVFDSLCSFLITLRPPSW